MRYERTECASTGVVGAFSTHAGTRMPHTAAIREARPAGSELCGHDAPLSPSLGIERGREQDTNRSGRTYRSVSALKAPRYLWLPESHLGSGRETEARVRTKRRPAGQRTRVTKLEHLPAAPGARRPPAAGARRTRRGAQASVTDQRMYISRASKGSMTMLSGKGAAKPYAHCT